MKHFTFIFFLMLGACASFAQVTKPVTGNVSGQIINGPSSETVYLDANNNGVLDPGEVSTVATGGIYSISAPPGLYVVRQILPLGFSQTLPGTPKGESTYGIHVKISSGSIQTNQNFTDAPLAVAAVSTPQIAAKLTYTVSPIPPAPCTVFLNTLASFPTPDSYINHKTTITVTGPGGFVCTEPSPMVAVQAPVAGTYAVATNIDGYISNSTFIVPAGNWTTYYYDALAGNDANKGTESTAPKKTFSNILCPTFSIHLLKNGPGETYNVAQHINLGKPHIRVNTYGPTTRPSDVAVVKWVGPNGPDTIFVTSTASLDYSLSNFFATSVATPTKSGSGRDVLAGSASLCNAYGTCGTFYNIQFDNLNRFVELANTHSTLIKNCSQVTNNGITSQVVIAISAYDAVLWGNTFQDAYIESPLRCTLPYGFQDSVICYNHMTRAEPGKAIVTIRCANNLHCYGNVLLLTPGATNTPYAFDQPETPPATHPANMGWDTNCLAENETLAGVPFMVRPGPQGCIFNNLNITVPTGPAIGIASTVGFNNRVQNCTVTIQNPTGNKNADAAVEYYAADTTTTVTNLTAHVSNPAGFTLSSNAPAGVTVSGKVTN